MLYRKYLSASAQAGLSPSFNSTFLPPGIPIIERFMKKHSANAFFLLPGYGWGNGMRPIKNKSIIALIFIFYFIIIFILSLIAMSGAAGP